MATLLPEHQRALSSQALINDLVRPGVLRYLRQGTRVRQVGRRGGCASTQQAFIHKLMAAEAQRSWRCLPAEG